MIYIKLDENEGTTVKVSRNSETGLANDVGNIIIEIKRGDFDA